MKCSVIIPTRDRPGTLIAAAVSALRATSDDDEVIVIDDNGSIPAEITLGSIQSPRLRVYKNTFKAGPSGARNCGVHRSTGDLIFFLDDDDEVVDDYCKRVLSLNLSCPEKIGYGHCAPYHLEPDGEMVYRGKKLKGGVYDSRSPIEDRLTGLGMGFWVWRDVFLNVGGIDEGITVNEDTDSCLALASMRTRCHYDPIGGVILRYDHVRPEGDSPSITKSAKAITRAKGFEHIVVKYQDFLFAHPRFRRLLLSRVLKYRSRALVITGLDTFIDSLRSGTDRVMMRYIGKPLLILSISIRKLRRR